MRALVQRVQRASVTVDGQIVGQIEQGLLVLLGVTHSDDEKSAQFVTEKCAHLRIFNDNKGKMNRSLCDISGEALVVSQFTLYGDTRKGRRPSFAHAAPPELAERLYERVVTQFQERGIPTQKGVFGAHMQIELINDGPVTILVESPETPT